MNIRKLSQDTNRVIQGDALSILTGLPDKFVNTIVTSPPYYKLRKYDTTPVKWPAVDYVLFRTMVHIEEMECELGLEPDHYAYIGHLIAIFREARRVLRDDGTCWINIGDSYAAPGKNRTPEQAVQGSTLSGGKKTQIQAIQADKIKSGLKPKDLIGIPAMLAFAMRDDGWYWRQDCIWYKPNVMPESVRDRCTKAHESVLMFSKKEKYYYDSDAIKEPAIYDVDSTGTAHRKARAAGNKLEPTPERNGIRKAAFKDASLMLGKHQDQNKKRERGHEKAHQGFNDRWDKMSKTEHCSGMRNKRDVWRIVPAQFPGAHFAVFPEELPSICIKAGCPVDGIVLDPFSGRGTTATVARKLSRNYLAIELQTDYVKMSEDYMNQELGMFK